MAETKTNAMRYLDKLHIPYTTHSYEVKDGKVDGISVANKINMPVEQVFKTIVTVGKKEYYVFVLPVDKDLNFKECAKIVGEKTIEMIKIPDIMKITGYIRGGCSPIGMKKQYVTVFDEALDTLDRVIISAGKIGQQIDIGVEDLKKAIPITVHKISV